MRNSNDTSCDELTIAELDTVSGGMLSLGRAATAPQSTETLTAMLQQILQQISKQGGSGST